MCLFCKHKYKIVQIVEVYSDNFRITPELSKYCSTKEIPIYHKLVLQCVNCGKVKIKKV